MGDLTERSTYSADMSSEEISYFLRQIADEIEGKPAESLYLSVKDFKKLEIALKREDRGFSLDLAIKYRSKASQDDKGDKHKESGHGSLKKYRAAKKRMKPLFKDICRSVSRGNLPSADLIQSFFRDSDQMISFHGNEYYQAYIAVAEEFRAAIDKGDLAAAKAGCEKIKRVKSECHKKLR
jgi:XXXCH domain-containing protein